jgi:proton-translocating NADH-quinone oxidoreductase chain L
VYEPVPLAWLILALPLVAAILAAIFWLISQQKKSAIVSSDHRLEALAAIFWKFPLQRYPNVPLIIACATGAILAIFLVREVALEGGQFISKPITWFAAGKLEIHYTINVDSLSAMMLAMITFISTWIAVFSTGYMDGDKGYARFFAVMSLFVFSMCGLVLANNFLFLIAFWEGVGLCSYLLVGYYFEKPSAAAAARKAFLVTRIGDTGFILGIFLLWRMGGWHTDLTALFDHIAKNPPETGTLTLACLLLFCGAVGKSAQFPLYVWLPDAMEGPTPVSALIHAATMVTAGVYLLARCAPLFARCPEAQIVISSIGGITALLAAFIALAQTDLKRILAYSTISQLGFMFLALGTVGAISPAFAVSAAMFHLFTHAFFKALLFLSAGSVMHAMGGVIDVRQFGGLRKILPITHITFLCGAAALAGIPLLSGFWSKDMIVESLAVASESNSPYTLVYDLLLIVAFSTAFMTAFYTFRAYFLTFWGEEKIPPEAGHHAHESPAIMTVPLVVLAVGALGVGIVVEPFTHWFSEFLGNAPSLQAAMKVAVGAEAVDHQFDWTTALVSMALALAGAGLAFALYRRGQPQELPAAVQSIFKLSSSKLHVEDLYEAAIVKPAAALAFLAKAFDGFMDGLTRLFAAIPSFVGQLTRPIQNGLVQFYALATALGLTVFLMFVVFRVTR